MKRRDFLQSIAAAGSVPLILNGHSVRSMEQSSFLKLLAGAGTDCEDHVLVMIQLNGGNDGLSTLVPVDQYDKLQAARSNIIVPENNLLNVNGSQDNKLHPSLEGLQTLWNDGRVKAIQNVGYPEQDFSHFRSTDIWLTASDADVVLNTGWAGRYFQTDHPNFPEGYPNQDTPDPLAIQVGYIASPAYHGTNANFGHTINNIDEFYELVEDDRTEVNDSPYGHELAFIRRTARQTNAYNTRIKAAADAASNLSNLYPEEGENELADQLKIVARCIGGGLKTKMYMVTLNGFDTHASQIDDDDPTAGMHADLLKYLGDAIIAFQDDIEKMGVSERVMSMTFSEFGRRIASNGSLGTDHGAAAPMFVFGNAVDSGIVGDNPEIPEQVSVSDNLPMAVDFRSVYGSILRDWFCVDEDTITDVFGDEFPKINLTQTSIAEEKAVADNITLFPNPVKKDLNVKIEVASKQEVRFELYNAVGMRIDVLGKKQLNRGENQVAFNVKSLTPGIYYLRSYASGGQIVKSFVKK